MSDARAWSVGIGLYSGRSDPVWQVPADVAARFDALWETLPVASGPWQPPPVLGYRGCFVTDGWVRHWDAWQGVVRLHRQGRSEDDELRIDPARRFERLVLESAPAGVLPDDIGALLGLIDPPSG